MKTLMQITRLSLFILLLAAFNGCKKSSEDNPAAASEKGSYTYLGSKTSATRGDYTLADGNIYTFIYGTAATDIVQFIFLKATAIRTGTFTYKPFDIGYNYNVNFTGGTVTSAAHPEGTDINGGTLTVSKSDDVYTFIFDCTTSKGSIKGSYTGTFTSR